MNTFKIKQQAIRYTEGVTGKVIDLTNPEQAQLMQSFMAGVALGNNLHVIAGLSEKDRAIEAVVGYYNMPLEWISIKTRVWKILRKRQMLTYILRVNCKVTYEELGEMFSQDHSTSVHSVHTMQNLLETDEKLQEDYKNIIQLIHG